MTQPDPEAYRTPGFMYGNEDEGNPIFPGNFDNFGYWEGIGTPDRPLTVEDRIASQVQLYGKIATAAQIGPGDVVLEVACGRGRGMRWLAEAIGPAAVHGVDASAAQVERAAAATAGLTNAHVRQGLAEALPFEDGMFDRAFSLEAVQHFEYPELFARELGRVVRTGGTIAVASFFSLGDGEAATRRIIETLSLPTFEDGIDKAVSVRDMMEWLHHAGFGQMDLVSIGDHVWERFVEWRNMVKQPANTGWLDAHRLNILDYFMITATKE